MVRQQLNCHWHGLLKAGTSKSLKSYSPGTTKSACRGLIVQPLAIPHLWKLWYTVRSWLAMKATYPHLKYLLKTPRDCRNRNGLIFVVLLLLTRIGKPWLHWSRTTVYMRTMTVGTREALLYFILRP